MNSHLGYKNRRSTSKTLPRLFLLLQVSIMMLLSYISYIISTAIGISQYLIIATLSVINVYYFTRAFFKCRSIVKRNSFGRGFSA